MLSGNAGLYFNGGNFQIATGGTLENTSNFFVLSDTGTASNFQQTGGYVYSGRSSSNDIYLSQGAGGCTYSISGGTLAIKTGGGYAIAVGYGTGGGNDTLNISGNAQVTTPRLELNALNSVSTGTATVNMQGGLLQVGQIFSQDPSPGGFNFSGGTIQPQGTGSAIGGFGGAPASNFIGNPTASDNITMQITGTGATYDTTDYTNNPQTATIYANLTGSGSLNVIGGGTLVFASTTASYNYSGQVNINSGTVRLTNPTSSTSTPLFTSGNANVNGGTLDVYGFPATAGTATLTSGLITNSQGGIGSLTATTFACKAAPCRRSSPAPAPRSTRRPRAWLA